VCVCVCGPTQNENKVQKKNILYTVFELSVFASFCK